MVLNKKTIQLVKNLNGIKPKQLRYVVNSLDHKTIHLLAEIIHNLNYNSLNLKGAQWNKLLAKMKKNEDCCKKISDPSISLQTRQRLVAKQAGNGLLSMAFSILAPIIGGLIATAVKKKK